MNRWKRTAALVLAFLLAFQLTALALEPLMASNSLPMMAETPPAADGDGVVIAVIDSGIFPDHEAFGDYGLTKHPAISREDVENFAAEGGSRGLYLSPKVPFVYDYWNRRPGGFTADDHGTHVAALAAGYVPNGDGSVKFRGIAPAAQLLIMKVFPDQKSGTADACVLQALEDAEALGADIVCMSLGADNGFAGLDEVDGAYISAFRRLREKGILLVCAAGNSGAATMLKTRGSTLPTGGYTDYGTLSAPGVYPGAISAAAADSLQRISTGCLAAGEKKLTYLDAQAGRGQLAPPLAELEGEYALVSVPGVGTAEDFAGVDAKGRIALVERGTIPFEEKTRNAAAAGAVAVLACNNTSGLVRAAVGDIPIPCATVSRADGEYLRTLAQRGTAVSVSRDDYVMQAHEKPAMMPFSAWGCAPGGALGPAITAPGGEILSAVGGSTASYGQLSGTSMAAPNTAGALALMLQTLRQRGVVSKKRRADLAEQLLESTAAVMTDANGTPLSPRQQGAGLIALDSALASDIVVTEPLVSLGEGGSFTMTFRVKNLGREHLVLDMAADVLTDAWGEDDDGPHSLLAPMDITDRVEVKGLRRIRLAPKSEQIAAITLTPAPELRREMEEVYPNGWFLEGYITASGMGRQVHSAFMGFCGDWEKAPVLEPVDFRDAFAAGEETLPVDFVPLTPYRTPEGFKVEGYPVLGTGSGPFLEDRCAIAGRETDALENDCPLMTAELYPLRNARRLIVLYTDAGTGKILHADDMEWVHRTTMDAVTGAPGRTAVLYFDGADGSGQALPDNTEVEVSVFGWVEGDEDMEEAYASVSPDPQTPSDYRFLLYGGHDRCLQWQFRLTIDRSAPEARMEMAEEGLRVTVEENQYLDRITLRDSGGELLLEETFADEEPGQSHSFTLAPEDMDPRGLSLTAEDYAGNVTAFALTEQLPDGENRANLSPCPAALLEDVALDAWYHDAVDYVYRDKLVDSVDHRRFAPEELADRGTVVKALFRLSGEENPPHVHLPFADVTPSMAFYEALRWAYDRGIVREADSFLGFAPVTAEQLAAMLLRFSRAAGVEDGDALAWAVENGLLPEGTTAEERIPRWRLAVTLEAFGRIDQDFLPKIAE